MIRRPTAILILRISIVCQWALTLSAIVLAEVLKDRLPVPLQEWLASTAQDKAPSTAYLTSVSLLLMLSVIGSIALYRLRRWGAWVSLSSYLVLSAAALWADPVILHPLINTIGDMSDILTGLALGLAFFSDALDSSPVAQGPGDTTSCAKLPADNPCPDQGHPLWFRMAQTVWGGAKVVFFSLCLAGLVFSIGMTMYPPPDTVDLAANRIAGLALAALFLCGMIWPAWSLVAGWFHRAKTS